LKSIVAGSRPQSAKSSLPASQLAVNVRVVQHMPKVERPKEEIGWLKVVFAVAVAVDASLTGWLAQNYDATPPLLFVAGVVTAVAIAFVLAYVNRQAYRCLKELEDL
jgi:hypothetical protein